MDRGFGELLEKMFWAFVMFVIVITAIITANVTLVVKSYFSQPVEIKQEKSN
jgi:hypothetical protein